MEDIAVRKGQIDMKLQREMGNLSLLKEHLARSNEMTDSMVSILTTFENRLMKLEETIVPVYQETGNLQRRHENIEKTLSSLDHVISFYHVTKKVENTIRESPSGDLSNYLSCMDKLQKALDYFTEHHPGSPELSAATMLFDQGFETLEREFRDELLRHSKPTSSVVLLDLLAADEAGESEEDLPKLDHLPVKVIKDLAEIAKWLVTNSKTDSSDLGNMYASVRSNTLMKTLQSLREHYKSASGTSLSTSMTPHSPSLGSKFRHSGREEKKSRGSSVKKGLMMARKASQALKRYSQQLDPGHKRTTSGPVDIKEEGSDVDIESYINNISALLKVIQSENHLMQQIIPEKMQRKTFDILVQPSLESIVAEGDQLSGSVRRAIARHDYPAVLSIFPVVRHLRSIKPEFDIALEGCQAPTRSKLASLVSTLDGTGAKALEGFIDNIRNEDKSHNMPRDGTVHELASNTMFFLEQLMEYTDAAGAMLMMNDPAALASMQDPQKKSLKLAEYTTKVLSALGLNLTNKADTYSDVTQRAVFMLNNYNYILNTMKRSGMLDMVHIFNNEVGLYYGDQILEQKRVYSERSGLGHLVSVYDITIGSAYVARITELKRLYRERRCGLLSLVHTFDPRVESFYGDQILIQKKAYSESFSRVLHYIMEVHKPISQQRIQSPDLAMAKLKDKDRQSIKDKFTGFNKEIEDLCKIQKGYAIPDPELREGLKTDNKDYILPKYEIFYRKYVNTGFTKNPDKYVKYKLEDVERLLEQFFDASA